jgi:hypothetical protein
MGGLAVVSSDYGSSNVSLLGPSGEVFSASFISSGSAPSGLSAALSGDVVFPSERATGDELVLIDRYPASVLTWVNLFTGAVRAQLNVSTGFAANPHDYVSIAPNKAYVTRFEPNQRSGREPFDAGNDVLVVDPSRPEIVGRIGFESVVTEPGFFARPGRAARLSDTLYVLASGFNADFSERVDARVVGIDIERDTIKSVTLLSGLSACVDWAVSPSGSRLLATCNGAFGGPVDRAVSDSGLVLFSSEGGLREQARRTARQLGTRQINMAEFISETTVALTTFGALSSGRLEQAYPDEAYVLDLETFELEGPLVQTKRVPFSLGEFRCDVGSGVGADVSEDMSEDLGRDTCFLTDAETDGGAVWRFDVDASGRLRSGRSVSVERRLGVPPRHLGSY